MSMVQLPSATLTDADVARVLGRAVRLINPVVDVLSRTDPLGLKGRSHVLGDADGSVDKALDALAWLLNTADVPGTRAWGEMDVNDRTNWWVRRVGALDTVVVAFPGFFGALADRLPIQDVLGFASQAIVLCAVAREHGIDDYQQQVRLLAAVMCDRHLASSDVDEREAQPENVGTEGSSPALMKSLWRLAGVVRAIGGELVKRPRPRRIYRYLGMLPAVGAVADYLGEYGALVRAAKEAKKWIAAQAVIVA